jgi:PRTRC genetic system protein B
MKKARFIPSPKQLRGHSTPTVAAECRFSKESNPAEVYELARVLCLYRRKGARDVELSMLHSVDKGVIQPGSPVNPVNFAKAIYRLKEGEKIERLRLLDERVLAENHRQVLWWRPASVTPMWFKTASPVPELTALNGVPIPQPALLFHADKTTQSLQVWALAENVRPTADTPIYHAPYMNLSPSPHVCLGNARANKSIEAADKSTPAQWEYIFFDSNFSHTPPLLNHAQLTTQSDITTKDQAKFKAYAAFLEALRKGDPADLFRRCLVSYNKRTLSSVL